MGVTISSLTTVTDSAATSTFSLTTSESPSTTVVGDVVIVIHGNDFYAASQMGTPTATGSPTMNAIVTADGGANEGHIKAWYYVANTSGAQTITFSETAPNDEERTGEVYVLHGADTTGSPIDGSASNFNNTSSQPVCPSISPANADSFCIQAIQAGAGSASSSYTAPAGVTKQYDIRITTAMSAAGGTEQLSASGATGTFSWTAANNHTWASVTLAVKTAAAASSVPWTPPRYPQFRDAGQSYWEQRDRRNANTVATAANPLASPLDSAWQADARYWHLYSDLAFRFTFVPYAQRDRRDANTVGSTASDPLTVAAGVGGDTWRRANTPAFADRREVPQQRRYVSDPAVLLAPFLLENELLGSADDLRRRYLEPAYYDRRLVPQQRPYVSDPLLLTGALLENELLGSADDLRRRYVEAAYYDRRQAGQQRAVFAAIDDTVIVGTGALGAWWSHEDWSAIMAGNRPRVGDPAGLQQPTPHDPTLDGWWPVWLEANRAATHVDRREVPQQRAYISDPAFYPTVPPTDPLTVAWGVQGTYWHLYNDWYRPPEVFQQRRYVSDPSMLQPFLLEDVLLGSADDLQRHYRLWAADRREVPQQRAYVSDPGTYGGPPADPTLLVGDMLRRWNTSVYLDRREVPQQPPRWTLYFDAGPGSPPLTLSAGAGGNLWHLYQWRRPARSWWPPRLLFTPLGDPCTVVRPSSGTTVRPFTGITQDPC